MKFSNKINKWYKQNKRDLPWRKTSDVYTIWLSEIIFQQTRINQGLEYFQRFINQYPTIELLAAAEEPEILKLWQGLGYYSRARNLLKTARIIVEEHEGVFPETESALLSLPGIGKYTAAAILSMAFNKPYPVVDGNVIRVLSRVFGIDEAVDKPIGMRAIEAKSRELLDKKNPGDYNQAVMEFGALFCKPKKPDCTVCIFKKECLAFQNNKVAEWPFKSGKVIQQKRYLEYLIFTFDRDDGKYLFVNHRKSKDIWQGLYDFPHFDSEKKITNRQFLKNIQSRFKLTNAKPILLESNKKHLLSHRILSASFFLIKLKDDHSETIKELLSLGYEIRHLETIKMLPIPRLIQLFLEKNMQHL